MRSLWRTIASDGHDLLGGHDHRLGRPRQLDVHVGRPLDLGVARRVDGMDVDQRHVGHERRDRDQQLVGERAAHLLGRQALEQVGAQQRRGGQERHAHRARHQPQPEAEVAPLLIDRGVALDVLAKHLGDPPAQPDPDPARDELGGGAGGQEQLGLVTHEVAAQREVAPLGAQQLEQHRPRRARVAAAAGHHGVAVADQRGRVGQRHALVGGAGHRAPTAMSETSGMTSAANRSTCSVS